MKKSSSCCTPSKPNKTMKDHVMDRYSEGAQARQASLCCPTDYPTELLKVIPQEVIEKDYGCGNPSQYLNPGDTVLDLGSGAGKICFIASQIVGPTGKVIGVDYNDDMLVLANKYRPEVASKIGYDNIEFRKSKIQDMKAAVADASVDVVVSNCVLNLVETAAKKQLFQEIYRTLKPQGRAIISDIVASKVVPQHLQDDPELWSGCISGALEEQAFITAFKNVGFQIFNVLDRVEKPWRTVEGIEFRSLTVEAKKSK